MPPINAYSLHIMTPPKHLNEQTKESFYQAIRAVVATDIDVIIVNLESVTTIDSSGLGVFLGASVFAHHQGQSLVLFNPQKQVRENIQLTGLDKLVTVNTTLRSVLKDRSMTYSPARRLKLPIFHCQI